MSGIQSTSDDWLEEHWDALYRYALTRVRDSALAEDLVQETLLAAFNNQHQFEQRASAKTWLIGIMKNKIVDAFRKSCREAPFYSERDDVVDALQECYFDDKQHWQIDLENWAHPEKSLEQQQFWEALSNCVDQLPPRMAQVFLLKEFDGLSSEEICKVANLSSTNNLWVILSRLRVRLRECLDTQWFASPRGDNTL